MTHSFAQATPEIGGSGNKNKKLPDRTHADIGVSGRSVRACFLVEAMRAVDTPS